jgi:hypothetical protein
MTQAKHGMDYTGYNLHWWDWKIMLLKPLFISANETF